MTKVYLVRHGETEYNKKGCYYGWTDCDLAPEGRRQAEVLKDVFSNIEYDMILSSDLKRAVETANIIKGTAKELVTDKRLRELNFGKWEGKDYQEVMTQYKEHWNLWVEDWANASPTEGESFVNMYDRVCEFMNEALREFDNKRLVIVSHNGVLRIIATYLLGFTLDKTWCFNFEHGKYSLLEINEGHCIIKGINNI